MSSEKIECSFCGAGPKQRDNLVAGPKVFVCSDCTWRLLDGRPFAKEGKPCSFCLRGAVPRARAKKNPEVSICEECLGRARDIVGEDRPLPLHVDPAGKCASCGATEKPVFGGAVRVCQDCGKRLLEEGRARPLEETPEPCAVCDLMSARSVKVSASSKAFICTVCAEAASQLAAADLAMPSQCSFCGSADDKRARHAGRGALICGPCVAKAMTDPSPKTTPETVCRFCTEALNGAQLAPSPIRPEIAICSRCIIRAGEAILQARR